MCLEEFLDFEVSAIVNTVKFVGQKLYTGLGGTKIIIAQDLALKLIGSYGD